MTFHHSDRNRNHESTGHLVGLSHSHWYIACRSCGAAGARRCGREGGIAVTSSALTINKMCGSGLKAVMLAAQGIITGDVKVVVAGGLENMSLAPHLVSAWQGWKFGDQKISDSMMCDGLVSAFDSRIMGEQAEYLARKEKISRADQDEFAVQSQRRTSMAIEAGVFDDETVPVDVPVRGGIRTVRNDQGVRPETILKKLAALKTLFEANSTVTAGNASQISDGAAATVVTSERFASRLAIKPLARIVASASSGINPTDVFVAPVPAIRKVLEKAKLSLSDIDLLEINEAFAAQMLVCIRLLEIPKERLNVYGGAIALGHSIGASGARVLTTLLHAMRRRGDKLRLAALCLGGGGAVAMIVEAVDQG